MRTKTTPAAEQPAKRVPWLGPLAAGLVPLAAYCYALQPGLPAGDSGELISVAATAGVAHPPGYPLYSILAGLWLRVLPFGTAAWRLNLFSAVCAAAAAAVLAIAVARATRSHMAGVLAAWAWAFSAQAFQWALVAEVFSLNALMAAGVLLALVSSPAAGSVALALLCALALSHHHTLLLLAGPAFAVTAWQALRPSAARAKQVVRMLIAGGLGLLPLLWLPLATRHAGALVWGEATTWRGFLSLLTRAEYGTFRLDPSGARLVADHSHLAVFARALPHALGALPLLLVAVGAVVLAATSRWRAQAIGLAAYLAAQAWFFTRVGFPANVPSLLGVVERFYILPLLVLAFLAGLGAAWLMARSARMARGADRSLAVGLLLIVLIPLPSGQLMPLSQRHNRFSDSLGRALLASLPRDAVLFVRGDLPHNALSYLQLVEHLRPDVVVIDQELMTYPWYMRQVRARRPGLLPPLDRAQRITLADGRHVEGLALARADGSVDLLTEQAQSTVPSASVVAISPAPAESLFAASHATFVRAPFLEPGEDRYSGLPGSRNLLWLDQLAGQRPAAMLGAKDESWKLRYTLVPTGFVSIAYAHGTEPTASQRLDSALAVADSVDLDAYFEDYAANSLERTETWRYSEFFGQAALLLCLPEAATVAPRHPTGHARVLAFARRFEPLTPSPDPACLAAIGYLRWADASLRDLPAARRDLERALAEAPSLADAARARRVLAVLRDSLR